jgi:hypothetical protein
LVPARRTGGAAAGAAIRLRLISLVWPFSAKSAKIHTQFPSANLIASVRSGSHTPNADRWRARYWR